MLGTLALLGLVGLDFVCIRLKQHFLNIVAALRTHRRFELFGLVDGRERGLRQVGRIRFMQVCPVCSGDNELMAQNCSLKFQPMP